MRSRLILVRRVDTDGDNIGNNADPDDDNDGVDDLSDVFPLDPSESEDTDGDNIQVIMRIPMMTTTVSMIYRMFSR